MSHVVLPNYRILNTSEGFNFIWTLTRGLLAAGWRYKASGDATGAAKDTSGNASQDRWGVGGAVNTTTVGANSATGAFTIGAASNGNSAISGLTGGSFSSTLSPGRYLLITGAVNANNNGIFRIVSQQSATAVTIFNPGAVAETTPAASTWAEKQGGAAASIAAAGTAGALPGRAIVTGLTGMVSPTTSPLSRGSQGDRLTIIGAATGANNGTFLITRVVSASSVEIDNASAVTDANNGSIVWVEMSPTAQVYAAHLQGATGQGAWLNIQGPSTMKIPIGNNTPTGSFVRGENVTQTTTGAQGEILGVLPDPTGAGLGYLVIMPRVSGTGAQATGPRGWNASNNTDTITGATSGATVTTPANSTPVEYVREMVFWKNTVAAGHVFAQCVDQAAESAARFSVLATAAATTATVAPGGATNTFPAPGSFVLSGTGGSNAVTTGSVNWLNSNQTTVWGLIQVLVANCIEGTGVSQDGSFALIVGTPTGNGQSNTCMLFQFCDNSEEGDVDPYAFFIPMRTGQYPTTGTTRTANTDVNSNTQNYDIFHEDQYLPSNTYSPWFGWRRRGFSTGDAWQQFGGQTFQSYNGGSSYGNAQTISKVACHPNPNIFIHHPFWVISTQLNQKMRKGTARWLFFIEGGTMGATYVSGSFAQFGTSGVNSSSSAAGLILGPWDGATIPLNG